MSKQPLPAFALLEVYPAPSHRPTTPICDRLILLSVYRREKQAPVSEDLAYSPSGKIVCILLSRDRLLLQFFHSGFVIFG